jgi:tRNA-dihydrouridine synthase
MSAHLGMCVDFYGEKNGVIIYRKFFSWYTKGLRTIRQLREAANHARNRQAMEKLILECAPHHR